jgi:phosphatidate phosphatase APP1
VTVPVEATQKAGVSRDLLSGGDVNWPVHGLRHPPREGTSGWYIWTGELSDADDFFVPLHPVHLAERLPEVVAELSAPPGSRFLLAPGHRDIWFDEDLLSQR